MTVIAHDLFKFDFSVLLKGLRVRVWRTIGIFIGGKNPTDVCFESIGTQIIFLDSIKYFQQSLAVLAVSMTDDEKKLVRKECKKFIRNDPCLNFKYNLCTKVEQYRVAIKGTIPYEMITFLTL